MYEQVDNKWILHDKAAGGEWEDNGVVKEDKQVRIQVGTVHDKMQAFPGQ